MLRIASTICLGLALASPAAAQSLKVEGRIPVTASPGGFTVQGGGGRGARGMWCAAAVYASKVLGAAHNQRVYVAKGSNINVGRFTLNSAGLTPQTASILGTSVGTPGANLSVTHAESFCSDFRHFRGDN